MKCDEYEKKIDPSVEKSILPDFNPKEVHLDTPIIIYGTIKKADEILSDLSSKIGSDFVVEVLSMAGKMLCQEEEYSISRSKDGDKVYADIISIQPNWGIHKRTEFEYHHYVCQCKTSSGDKVWVHMTYGEYAKKFDSSVEKSTLPDFNPRELHLDTPVRIHGTVKSSELILPDISSKIGSDCIIEVDSID